MDESTTWHASRPLVPRPPLVEYTLRLGDDALILSQRLGEWVTRAPELEEDVALANIALDLLGQARSFLTYAADIEGMGRDEDDLAYLRDDREFSNALLVECENGDFGATMARLLCFSAYQFELYDRLRAGSDDTLAAIAAKGVKEAAYHRDHASQWVMRLGDGTDESRRRVQAGLDTVAPYVSELFDGDAVTAEVADAGVDPGVLREPWTQVVNAVMARAGLQLRLPDRPDSGGRRGLHTEAMGYLLAEMQHLHRSHPGVSW